MAVDYEDFRSRLERIRQGLPAAAGAATPVQGGGESALDRYRRERNARFATAVPMVSASNVRRDDGPSWDDPFRFAGRQALNVLDKLQMPFAAVGSGLKEAADVVAGSRVGEAFRTIDAVTPKAVDYLLPLPVRVGKNVLAAGEAGDASMEDFRDQFNRRAGSRELGLNRILPGTEVLPESVAGFVTDIALDPLTYTPGVFAKQAIRIGTKALPKTAAEGALLNAVRSGGSRQISETLATNALQAGVGSSKAVQSLIADAAIKGRGALTSQGLRRAGLTADEAGKLGLSVAQPNVAVRTLQGAENIKGAIKQTFRTTEAAKGFRRAFVSDRYGRRALLNETLNKSLPVSRRAAAVLAEVGTDRSVAEARRWAARTIKSAELQMMGTRKAKGLFADMSDVQIRQVVRNVEQGVDGEAENLLRGLFRKLYEEQRLGYQVQLENFGPNYVPHQFTDEWRDLADKNEEVRRAFENILSRESYQKTRTLLKDDEFLGEVLKTGTIDEINEIALKKYNVKIFNDDARDIVPRYIMQAEDAVQRAVQIRQFQELGLGEPLARKLTARTDPASVYRAEQLQKAYNAAKKQANATLRNGTQIRFDLLTSARQVFEKRHAEINARILQATQDLNAKLTRVQQLQSEADDLTRAVAGLERNVAAWRARLDAASGAERARLRSKLDDAQANLRRQEKQITDLRAQIDAEFIGAKTPLQIRAAASRTKPQMQTINGLRAEIAALRNAADSVGKDYKHVVDAIKRGPIRDDVDLGQINPDLAKLQETVLDASDNLNMFMVAKNQVLDEADIAETIYLFAASDTWFARQVLDENAAKLKVAVDGLADVTRRGPATEQRLFELSDRFDAVKQILDRADISPEMKAIVQLEAAASKADLAATRAGNTVKMFEQMIAANKTQSQDIVLQKASKGMKQVGDDLQIPDWLFNATNVEAIKKEMPMLTAWQRKYFNLFKGYAILRPGFHVRNLYSAMFNMYLEAGPQSFAGVKRWHDFYTLATHDPEDYMTAAVKKFGQVEADRLDEVWRAISATGAGGGMAEFTGRTFKKPSKNPFDENNKALAGSRRWGGWVEDHVRGAHAYDVLRRGGTMEQAMDTVSRWHFNYVDVTDFDQKMKLINPFWIFFSRNMALQAQAWVKTAPKINRTFVNFERNMNYGLEEDGVVPEYFYTEGATRLPIKGLQGDSVYWFSDLPALTFAGELDRLSDPTSARFFADLGPFLKVPFELAADRQLFSDIPIDKTRPERLPLGLGRLPGAEALSFLPGFEETGSGELVLGAEAANVIRSLIPGYGQVQRIAPVNDPKALEKLPYTGTSFLGGLTLAENTARAQQGEIYRRNMALAEELKRLRRLAEM